MQEDDLASRIAARVRAGRQRLKLTRRELSLAAGVSVRYLSALEMGAANASIAILAKVAGALEVDLVSLLEGNEGAHSANGGSAGGRRGELVALVDSMSDGEQAAALPVLRAYLAERRRAARGIALLGLRGAGKSTLGRLLAERRGLKFVSITREIEVRAGLSIADLFNLGGADAYRALENEVVGELARSGSGLVIETAGGIAANGEALALIIEAFKTVWLRAAPEEHLARVSGQGDLRPMQGHSRALEHLRALLEQRQSDYARAEHVLDTSGRSIEACIASLEAIVGPEPPGLERAGASARSA